MGSSGLSGQRKVNEDLTGYVHQLIRQLPEKVGMEYRDPTEEESDLWAKIVLALLEHRYAQVDTMVHRMDYEILEFQSGNQVYYLLQKTEESDNYWGTYIFQPSACRNLIIQCPHPIKDRNTGEEGIRAFVKANAFFYCLPGTNRCNREVASPCSGTTSVCSSQKKAFRISDVAHNDQSLFQMTTKVLHAFDSTLVFIQLHGFTKRSTDPYVILSNGTTKKPENDYIVRLADALKQTDGQLTFKIAHEDLSWKRLRGFTNVQGRLVNGSPDPCQQEADQSEGLFIHIEQERLRLRKDSMAWDKMAKAIEMSFPCEPLSTQEKTNRQKLFFYPNPLRIASRLEMDISPYHIVHLQLFDLQGRTRIDKWYSDGEEIYVNSVELVAGVYYFRLMTPDNFLGWGTLVVE